MNLLGGDILPLFFNIGENMVYSEPTHVYLKCSGCGAKIYTEECVLCDVYDINHVLSPTVIRRVDYVNLDSIPDPVNTFGYSEYLINTSRLSVDKEWRLLERPRRKGGKKFHFIKGRSKGKSKKLSPPKEMAQASSGNWWS
jgi:hypothetical protein